MPLQELPKAQVATPVRGEALKPTSPAYDAADRPPRGRDRAAFLPKAQPAPRRHSNKKARGDTLDLRDVLEDKEKYARSIYGSRGRTTTRDDNRHAGYSKSKSGRA